MKALVVYNGGLGKNYVLYDVVRDLIEEAKLLGIDLISRSNEDLLVFQDSAGSRVLGLDFDPSFILFLDKDLFLAKSLEAIGYPIFNSPKAIELCDDKKKTYQELLGLPVPKTIFSPLLYHPKENLAYCQAIWSALKPPLIIKAAQGSFGEQVFRVERFEDLVSYSNKFSSFSYLVQECIEDSLGRDIRVVIVGDRVLGAMKRTNDKDFRANIYLGGQGKIYPLSQEEKDLALEAHRRLGLTFSGVDLLFSNQGPLVCEVNSNLSYLGFKAVHKIPVGQYILEEILSQLGD